MRDLQECQAEIFRRSEKRIKDRRQRRNHMLMACVPLMLVVAVCAAFIRPVGTKSNAGAPELGQQVYSGESISYTVRSLEVSGPDFYRSYTDDSQAIQISEKLMAWTVGSSQSGHWDTQIRGDSETAEETDNAGSMTGSATGEYIITLVTYEGEKTVYSFAGSVLKDLTANQIYTLSQKQVKELKEMLGIPLE